MFTLLITLLAFVSMLALASFWCLGFQLVVKNILDEVFGIDIDQQWMSFARWKQLSFKPLFACPYCMASVHGTIIFFLFMLGTFSVMFWIPFCICLCGLNYIIYQFFITE